MVRLLDTRGSVRDGALTKMTKLVPEIKAEWIKALRSGEYEQGRIGLRHGDTYCCLGVLCDIAVRHGIIPVRNVSKQYLYGDDAGTPPQALVQWAFGTDKYIPKDQYIVKTPSYGRRNLIFCNDVARYTFTEIANLIERDL